MAIETVLVNSVATGGSNTPWVANTGTPTSALQTRDDDTSYVTGSTFVSGHITDMDLLFNDPVVMTLSDTLKSVTVKFRVRAETGTDVQLGVVVGFNGTAQPNINLIFGSDSSGGSGAAFNPEPGVTYNDYSFTFDAKPVVGPGPTYNYNYNGGYGTTPWSASDIFGGNIDLYFTRDCNTTTPGDPSADNIRVTYAALEIDYLPAGQSREILLPNITSSTDGALWTIQGGASSIADAISVQNDGKYMLSANSLTGGSAGLFVVFNNPVSIGSGDTINAIVAKYSLAGVNGVLAISGDELDGPVSPNSALYNSETVTTLYSFLQYPFALDPNAGVENYNNNSYSGIPWVVSDLSGQQIAIYLQNGYDNPGHAFETSWDQLKCDYVELCIDYTPSGGGGGGITLTPYTGGDGVPFDEVLFPVLYPYGTQYGPRYTTAVTNFPNNAEQRITFTPVNGCMVWKLKKDGLSLSDVEMLEGFFRGRRGRWRGFRLKHWQNHYKSNEPLPYINGNTTLQLQFLCGDSFNQEIQIVYKPIDSLSLASPDPDVTGADITLQKDTAGNGIFNPFPASGNWTLDRTTGIITLTGGAQANGTQFKWSGDFHYPVRLNTDNPLFTPTEFQDYISAEDYEFIELKNPG